MTMPKPILYKEFYNKSRGLPEPKWGSKAEGLQCPTCGSTDMYYSGSPDDPEEVFGDTVRCKNCGRITDYYEAHKQKQHHPTGTPMEVVGRLQEKSIGQFKLNVGTSLQVFDGYGLSVYIPQVVEEITKLALQLHERLKGNDVQISLRKGGQ